MSCSKCPRASGWTLLSSQWASVFAMAQLSSGGGSKDTVAAPPDPLIARASTRTGSSIRQAGSFSSVEGVAGVTRLPGMADSADRHELCPAGVAALSVFAEAGAVL